TLFHGKRGHGKFSKAVEAIKVSCPDIAFSIFEESINEIARETVKLCEHICPSLVYMHKTLVESSDPQTPIVIAEQILSAELLCSARELISLNLSIDQSSDSALRAKQERTIFVLTKRPDTVHGTWDRIEVR